jgi:hypothetical protein
MGPRSPEGALGAAKVEPAQADGAGVSAAPVLPEILYHRIELGDVLALRHMPRVLAEVNRAVAIGARVVELDAKYLARMTEGARQLVELAQRRWAEQNVELRFAG